MVSPFLGVIRAAWTGAPAARFGASTGLEGNRPRPVWRAAVSAVRYGRSRWRRAVQPVCRAISAA
jgi:hypothetical protein